MNSIKSRVYVLCSLMASTLITNLVQRCISMDIVHFEVFLKNIHSIPQDQIVKCHYLQYK